MTNFDLMNLEGLGMELVLRDGRVMRGTLVRAKWNEDEITLEVGPGRRRTVKISDVEYESLRDMTESHLIGPEPKGTGTPFPGQELLPFQLHVVPVRTVSVPTLSKIFHPNPSRSDRLTSNRSGYIIYISSIHI